MRPDALMIFAAGFGTRMGALTADRPKPLIPVAGRPLIDHALDLANVPRIVVNTHYHAGQMFAHLRDRHVEISHEDTILETGGGLKAALPLLGAGPVLTLNADAVWSGPNPLDMLTEAWDPTRMDALLVLIPPAQAKGHSGQGDFISASGILQRGPGLIYTGAQIIKTERLADIPDLAFSLNVLWDQMLSQGRMHGITYPGRWCDVGRPEGIAQAEDMLRGADG